MTTPAPLVLSYLRFSSKKQEAGDSVRRQRKLADDYAKEKGWVIDPRNFSDLGLSAFKGKNVREGALGAFLKAVDDGVIPAGSILLVESLDRVTRTEVMDALEIFTSIINRGITLVTISDRQHYSRASIKDNWTQLIISISTLARANEESVVKSMRVKAAWAKKAANGETLTKMCPAWMKHDGEKFVIDEDRAATVRRIFAWFIGGHGSPTIAKLLNKEGTKPHGCSLYWTNGVVANILKNPATYGTLRRTKADQPSIPGYYPPVIDEATYLRAHAMASTRRWKGGQKGKGVANLFSGMAYCGACGSKLRVVSTAPNGVYLKCLKSYNKAGCDAPKLPLIPAENAVLKRLLATQNRDVLAMTNVAPKDPTAPLKAAIQEDEQRLSSLIKLVEQTGEIDAVAKRIAELQHAIDKAKRKLATTVVEQPFTDDELDQGWELYHRLTHTVLPAAELMDLRLKLQAAVRRILSKVEFLPDRETVRLTFGSGTVRELQYERLQHGFAKGNVNGRVPEPVAA